MIPALPREFTHPMRIGEGTFASVLRARQTALDRWVAVKVLRETDPQLKKERLREARVQGSIRLQVVPQVYDAFEWRGRVYIVMEWIKGVALKALIERNPSAQMRLWAADGFIRALAQLHDQGFIHRDLKPANTLVSPERGICLVDFGFTRKAGDSGKSMTGYIKGTPAYMAPELWRGGTQIDHFKADVYSAGLILREILTGPEAASLLERMTTERPQERIATGGEVFREWRQIQPAVPDLPESDTIVRQLSAELLSTRLYQASRDLLLQGKENEAYWLLVEALEENPEYAEAVELMHSFPVFSRKQRRRRQALAATAACGIAGMISFAYWLGGSNTMTGIGASAGAHVHTDRIASMLHGRKTAGLSGVVLPLKEAGPAGAPLHGRLIIENRPAHGNLFIDAVKTTVPQGPLAVSYGTHSLQWKDDDGRIVWRQTIRILPFQLKTAWMQR